MDNPMNVVVWDDAPRSQAQDQLQLQQPLPQGRQPSFAEVAAGFQLQETPQGSRNDGKRWRFTRKIWDFIG